MIGRVMEVLVSGGCASPRAATRTVSFHTAHRSIGSVLDFANHGARGRAPSHNLKPKT